MSIIDQIKNSTYNALGKVSDLVRKEEFYIGGLSASFLSALTGSFGSAIVATKADAMAASLGLSLASLAIVGFAALHKNVKEQQPSYKDFSDAAKQIEATPHEVKKAFDTQIDGFNNTTFVFDQTKKTIERTIKGDVVAKAELSNIIQKMRQQSNENTNQLKSIKPT